MTGRSWSAGAQRADRHLLTFSLMGGTVFK